MEPRFDMLDNEIGAKFSKRFANASMVLIQSPLPQTTQELVNLRASQINGPGSSIRAGPVSAMLATSPSQVMPGMS